MADIGHKITFNKLLWSLISLNCLIFLIIKLSELLGNHYVLSFLELPSSLALIATKPWTPFTYMFTQYGVLHIIFNMLALYWFGSIISLRLVKAKFLLLYIVGGLAGALFYVAVCSFIPSLGGNLVGSSAAVMAIMVTTAVLMPDYQVGLLLLGPVKLKWIAIASLLIFALGLTGSNAGGHIAHIGGMAAGLVFGVALRINDSRLRKKAREARVRPTDTERLDNLLDKIKRSGYSSLTPREKEALNNISNHMNKR